MSKEITERVLRILRFDYVDARSNEKTVARRGDTLFLNEADLAKGERLDFFEPVDVAPEVEEPTLESLVEWIREDKPKVKEIVAKSEGNIDLARLLLEAENVATDGNARPTVVSGLGQTISALNQ